MCPIVCSLLSFLDTTAILFKFREHEDILFNGSQMHVLKDLALSTLLKHKTLNPLTVKPYTLEIQYHWLYPFEIAIYCVGKRG